MVDSKKTFQMSAPGAAASRAVATKAASPLAHSANPAAAVHTTVLRYPITTEKAIGMIELENKLVFVVEPTATKGQIKAEIERLFKVKVGHVNTKITPTGIKHAYIRLKEGKADDIAAQLKIV